jgi:hypothetical protein
VENFPRPKYARQHTTIHHRSTTNSPAKNHVLHTVFPENPSKNTTHRARKINPQKSTTNPSTIAA